MAIEFLKSGIYKITNLISGKFYIGSAVYIVRRWAEHRSALNRNIHKNKYLQSAWNKNEGLLFEFKIIEYCEIEKLIEREQFYLDYYKPFIRIIGYNLSSVAGSQLGFRHSEESKKKMAIAQTGKKMAPISIARTVAGNTGQKRTPEQRARMSAAQKGKIVSDETRALMSKNRKGIKHSESFKEKLKATNKLKREIYDTYDCHKYRISS